LATVASDVNANPAIRLHPDDNVLIAMADIAAGAEVGGVVVASPVPRMHKIASKRISEGQAVLKYSQVIGIAVTDIEAGEHVHTHNCRMAEFDRDYAFCQDAKPTPLVPQAEQRTFRGYRRADGRAATRNFIGVLTSVNCSGTVARMIADQLNRSGVLDDYPNVDGVVPLVHGSGCCMGGDDSHEGFRNLKRLFNGYALHPNFAATLMVGLGCETMQIPDVMREAANDPHSRLRTLTIQEAGGTTAAVEQGKALVVEMLAAANAAERVDIPASELIVALECGGSDGFSGITANPALGAAVDLLVRQGGTAILAETPEIYGAEHLLTRRAVSREVGEKLLARIEWWKSYAARNGGEMDNNPTPGNKQGGLTTILEKSLGAQAKGGSTSLQDVYEYAEPVSSKGLVFMDSPGFDPASVTGMVASGANVVCFTTGRGSAFGFKPSPSIKIATNTPLFERMSDDMDINGGTIAEGLQTVQEKGQEIFEEILAVASGKKTRSELLGYGENEFTPWQPGAVM